MIYVDLINSLFNSNLNKITKLKLQIQENIMANIKLY
jgi:hypothetical protein